ncbi:MAG TPA: globin [Acidimicrobiales bacterium]|nr:globin [Acidimicrobiales bacterium]
MRPVRRPANPEDTPFRRWGGEPFFAALVDRFYVGVEGDPLLRPLYPDDLTEPKAHLALFLAQYWGGPAAFNEQRGQPRLRMRHDPFAIGTAEANAWLGHMTSAIQSAGLEPGDEEQLLDYMKMAAKSLINART